ncbi:MAG: LPS assembly lipoprotein LptE [Isosphaeraceae bacterium]
MLGSQAGGSRFPRSLAVALALATVTLATSGCGYTLRAPFDPEVQTVYVPIFRSISFRRDVNLMLTELVQKEIERRSTFKVVGTPDGADTILDGTINFADKNIVVENPFNLPRQLTATLNATVNWTHNPPTAEELAPGHATIVAESVNFVPEIGETSETAFYRACQALAKQIVDMMESPW